MSLVTVELAVIVPTLLGLAYLFGRAHHALRVEMLLWAVAVAVVELLPVAFWRDVQISMGFPLLIGAGFVYAPVIASLIALAGSFDPREFRRQVTLTRALFNRCQIAVSVLAASEIFHVLVNLRSPLALLIGAAMLSTVADYIINVSVISGYASILYRLPVSQVVQQLRVGRVTEFLVSYLALGIMGLVLAQLFDRVGFWSVIAFLIPSILARQMFFRSRALEEAHKELKERELVLRALSDRMAEERQDERQQIAAYLHDDLAQLLFRLSLQVDVARKHLRAGDAATVERDLEDIRRTKTRTADLVRALIRDLHRSPLGRAGLAEAISSFTEDLAGDSGVAFHIDVDDLPLAPAVQLLVYHIAREAITNALRHAAASNVWVSLKPEEEDVVLTLRDDGVGFDPAGLEDEGHFGLAMMRERAQLVGGTLALASAPGEGASVTVRFPASWLGEPQPEEEAPEHSSQPGPSIEQADPAVAPPVRSQGPDEPEDAVGGGEIEEQVPVQGADVP